MSPDGDLVLYEASGAVARLTLNRPAKRNALDRRLIAELGGALDRAEADPEIRVVTITGAGPDFCAGADLAELGRTLDSGVVGNLGEVEPLARLFLRLRRLRMPVVALVHGRALGGGCGLATGCDLVLAEEGARFGYPEVRVGFVPALVTTMLRRNVSEKRAFELIALGDTIPAIEAERIGLINRVFAADRFAEESRALIDELAAREPEALLLTKRLLYHQDGLSFERAIESGIDVNVLARFTNATREGVARFLERS